MEDLTNKHEMMREEPGQAVREPKHRSWGRRSKFGSVVYYALLFLSDIAALEECPPPEMK